MTTRAAAQAAARQAVRAATSAAHRTDHPTQQQQRPRNPLATQVRIIAALANLSRVLGRPPSRRELAAAAGICAETLQHHLGVLREHGDVTWEDRKHRTLRLVPIAERMSLRAAR